METQSTSGHSSYHEIQRQHLESRSIRHVLVVSDLHMSEGYSTETFRWKRIENFTSDKTFSEFLQKKSEVVGLDGSKGWLIINGDFIDYLRIISTPKSQKDLDDWKNLLEETTTAKLPGEKNRVMGAFNEYANLWQESVLSEKKSRKPPKDIRDELKYGFKTHDFKSVYRLMSAVRGHQILYKALVKWMAEGHPITIVSGNHDKEFDQKLVQAALLCLLEDLHFQEYQIKVDLSDLLAFEEYGLIIDGKICIEHGHRFETYTSADEKKKLDSEHHELFLAPGSLFNRYLINRLEIEIPYFDNIRPTTRVIGFLVRNHPLLFLKSILKVFETAWRLSRKRGTSRLIMAGALKILQIIPLICYAFWLLLTLLTFNGYSWGRIWGGPEIVFGLSFSFYIALPFFIVYFWALNKVQKKLSLYFSEEKAKVQMTLALAAESANENCYAICGHTHVPDTKYWTEKVVYINSGTWTPVFDFEGAQERDDLTMTFVELRKEDNDWKGKLARWLPFHNMEADLQLFESRKSE